MSHCNGYEILNIFGDEDNSFNHFLPSKDEGQTLESVTFTDSHKKPRYEVVNDVKTSIYCKDPANVPSPPRKDGRVLPSALKEGNFNILDHSWSLLTEKTDQALCHTKCSTGSTILDCQDAKISTGSFREDEKGSRNITLCSDYPFPEKKGIVHHKKLGDISSAKAFISVMTKEQRDGEDDQQFYDCPIIGEFEDFDRMIRNLGSTFAQRSTVTEDEIPWFSSTSHGIHGMDDTLQSVVLSSVSESSAFNNTSSSHGLPAIVTSAIDTETPSGTRCSPLPTYSDIERKGKSPLSESATVHAGIVEKSSALENICYGNEYIDPNMINMKLKELYTTTGKKVNSTLGSTEQSLLCGCVLTHNVQNQELLSSVLSAPYPCSLQAISKQNLFSESYASNCLRSYNPQAQISGILKLQHVCPTLTSSVIESNALPDHTTIDNLLSNAPQSIEIQTRPFSLPPMPIVKNEEVHARQKFAAALVMDKPLEQHATSSDGSVQRKFTFEDKVVDGKKPVYTSGNLPAVNISSSGLQGNSRMTRTFLDDVSQKVDNFQQLQMITDQLGCTTKLCIRDSLYRLARSAEQSHYYGTENSVSSGSCPMIGLQGANDSKRPPEILGVSTSTNAIERSVAYLLFHKYLNSGTGTTEDGISFKSPIHINCPLRNSKEPVYLLDEGSLNGTGNTDT